MAVLKYKDPDTGEVVVVGGGSTDSYSKEEIDEKIYELKTSVSEGKSLIAAAVTDKGVETAANASFATMASNISSMCTQKIIYRAGDTSFSNCTFVSGQRYSFEQDYFYIDRKTDENNRRGWYCVTIDLTNYDILRFSVIKNDNPVTWLGLSSTQLSEPLNSWSSTIQTESLVWSDYSDYTNTTTIEADISSYTGIYYLYLVCASGVTGTNAHLEIYDIRMFQI